MIDVDLRDRIMDFEGGFDKIDLSGIDARPDLSGDQAFTWRGSAAFSGAGQVRYYNSGGDTIIQVNTVGAGDPEMEIVVHRGGAHSASDFIL